MLLLLLKVHPLHLLRLPHLLRLLLHLLLYLLLYLLRLLRLLRLLLHLLLHPLLYLLRLLHHGSLRRVRHEGAAARSLL
jgi:hypothetical protein